MDNLEKFLEELTALSLKYEIFIGGCGCCGSPFLTDIKTYFDEEAEGLYSVGTRYTTDGKNCLKFGEQKDD